MTTGQLTLAYASLMLLGMGVLGLVTLAVWGIGAFLRLLLRWALRG